MNVFLHFKYMFAFFVFALIFVNVISLKHGIISNYTVNW